MNAPAPDASPLDWARWYVEALEWCIFPLAPRSKTPLTATGFHAASRDLAQIERWWTENPRAGIGIPAGPNGLVILDFDPRKGGRESYRRLLDQSHHWAGWQTTARVRSGGADRGLHFYFRSDEPWRARTILPGVDVRAAGTYCAAPPTVHPDTGRLYEWQQLPDAEHLLPLPDFLASSLSQASTQEPTPSQPLPSIPEGERHGYLLSMAGEMRKRGRSLEAIRAALLAESESRFVPPEDEDAIEQIVRSASEWPPGAAGPSGITIGASLTDEGNAKRLTNEYGHQIRYDAMRSAWRRWDGKRWVLDDKHEVEWLARQVVQHIHFAADQEHDEKQKQAVRAWARRSEGGGRVEAMLKLARSTPDIVVSAKLLDADPLLLNCANGVLDLQTGELLPHDPKRAISKLCPWPYDSAAPKPGRWQAFLDRILPGKEEQEWLQVLFGYCLTGLTSDQAFWVLWGAPGTGKSTTIDTMREVIGPDYAQVAQQTLLMEKKPGQATNDLATLHGARVVLHGDLPKGSLDIDLIKQLTGDGKVRARHLYMESFEFTPQCKLLISANTRPVMNENTAGIWRRLNLEIFGQQITETERVFDFYKLLVREEAPLILKWAVDGYWKYIERGRVPKPQSSITATKQYEADTDYLAQFLWDRCEQGEGRWGRFSDLLTAWSSWATENGLSPRRYNRPWLKEELARQGLAVERRVGVEGVVGVEVRAPTGRTIEAD